jgi:protein O-mannosyl-transferase
MHESKTLQRLKSLAPLLLVCLCAFAVNANTLLNDFVYDDVSQVLDNNWITNVKYLPDIFSHDATHANALGVSNYYRPAMNVVYMASYYLFGGLKPWGFHLVNILFHAGVAMLVFLTARELLRDEKGLISRPFFSVPLVAALIFAVHPANSEVVAWVACIPELTFTFFCLVSFYFHARSERLFDTGHLLSLAAFTIALFCKETAVTLIPILMLYDLVSYQVRPNFRSNVARYALLALPIALYAVLRFHALGGMAPMSRHPELNTFEIVINTVPLFCQYLGKLLLPIGMSAFYVLHPVRSVFEPRFLVSAAIVIAFVVTSVILFRKSRPAFLALTLITVPLLPVLYIRGLGENTFADRYLYFPSIGFALLAGVLFTSKRLNRRGVIKVPAALLAAILATYAAATVQRNAVWRDELSLWTDTVRKSPDSYMVHAQLGSALNNREDFDGALREYRDAIRLCTERIALLQGLDASKSDSESINRALQECTDSLALLHNGRGLALLERGDIAAAINEYRAALSFKDNYTSHVNLGNIFYGNHNDDDALREYLKAISLDNNSYEAHNNLGSVYLSHGRIDLAIKEYQEALALNPNYQDARNNLEMAMRRKY